jgi:hypothetical protein
MCEILASVGKAVQKVALDVLAWLSVTSKEKVLVGCKTRVTTAVTHTTIHKARNA